jgi:uncharacterized protein (TIGR02996 family)
MHDETAFLQALLADPSDDGLRLVYADWLEEQGAPMSADKAGFLRLTADLTTNPGRKRQRKTKRKRLQELAAGLDTDWLAVVSRLPVENCHGKRMKTESQRSYEVRFDYLCDRRWEDLQTTTDQAVRFCDDCRHNVHYCGTIMEARKHAQKGHCIAVDLGVIRREDDLAPRLRLLGWPSPELLRQEEERVRPDPVSAERERRKRGEPTSSPKVALTTETGTRTAQWRGERVRVRDGTFAGMEGVVREILEAKSAVRVEVTIFGRSVPVELEYWQVELTS